MAKLKPKITPVSNNDNTIILKDIRHFHARGMKKVHGWRLTRMTEFSQFYTYHGEIWAAKDSRLLVRFKFRTGLCLENYEICGMTAADLFNIEFDPASAEAEGLEGNVIAVRDNGKNVVVSCAESNLYLPPEECLWLSWVPPCVRDAWERWVDEIENS